MHFKKTVYIIEGYKRLVSLRSLMLSTEPIKKLSGMFTDAFLFRFGELMLLHMYQYEFGSPSYVSPDPEPKGENCFLLLICKGMIRRLDNLERNTGNLVKVKKEIRFPEHNSTNDIAKTLANSSSHNNIMVILL